MVVVVHAAIVSESSWDMKMKTWRDFARHKAQMNSTSIGVKPQSLRQKKKRNAHAENVPC